MEGTLALLIPIIITLGAFAMVLGIRHFENKENMGMIEKGMNPNTDKKTKKSKSLREGYLFIGAGLGLAIAYILSKTVFAGSGTLVLYFALAFMFGGVGLVIAHNQQAKQDREERDSSSRSITE